MILESLAALNFALSAFDAYLTQRRIREYGVNVEMNCWIRKLSTQLGPQTAALIGVMVPGTLWTYCFLYFSLGIPLAFLTGFNLKRFLIQLTSIELERDARVHKLLDELGGPSSEEVGDSDAPSRRVK